MLIASGMVNEGNESRLRSGQDSEVSPRDYIPPPFCGASKNQDVLFTRKQNCGSPGSACLEKSPTGHWAQILTGLIAQKSRRKLPTQKTTLFQRKIVSAGTSGRNGVLSDKRHAVHQVG